MPVEEFDWSVVIFGMNEARTIGRCLASVERQAEGRRVHVTVMLNGSTDGSAAILEAHAPQGVALTTYAIAKADKANAINQYIHATRPPARHHFLMDAYVELEPGALAALSAALDANPYLRVASGLPLNGRSATWFRAMLLGGSTINGNIYAVRRDFLDRMAGLGLRLPLHIYRTDPLLGSMAAHNFDALGQAWEGDRLMGIEGAGYTITPLSMLNWRDIRRQFRREINQARGLMESAAIKSIIYKRNYAALPADADDMLRDWLRAHRPEREKPKDHLFLPLAIRQLGTPRPPTRPEALIPNVLRRAGLAEPVGA